MKIPVFADVKYFDQDGGLTDQALLYQEELNQVLQTSLSDNGWTVPNITHAQLVQLQPNGITLFYETMPDGSIWYESTNNVFVGKVNGSLMKFTMAAYP